MAVDLKLLEKRGITVESLKKLFDKSAKGYKPSEKLKSLLDYITDILREGIENNLAEGKIYWVIDKAYDVTFKQTTQTLAGHLVDQKAAPEQVELAVRDLGLTHLISNYCPACKSTTCAPSCTCTNKTKFLDVPLLFNIFVPLVKSYVKRNWAKLFNDRDRNPHYRYDPIKLTLKNKLKCDIITDRINLQAAQCGYRADRQQAYLQALLYGHCIKFPRKSWTAEEQTYLDDDGKEQKRIVKEGVINVFPHPAKYFYDPAHRPCTLNSDTGCRYGGYWDICRWGEIKNDPHYWNKESVGFGGSTWFTNLPNTTYMNLFPCVMKFPTASRQDNDRESQVGQYGTGTEENAAFVRTNLFLKLVPKDWGLGDYDQPVWFRFVIGAVDTIMYCEPFAYAPLVYYGPEADGNRTRNSSMAHDILPFQDHLGNILTQTLLTMKKNLLDVVFWNEDIVNASDILKLRNMGNKRYEGRNFIGFSAKELGWKQEQVLDAFYTPAFPQHNIAEGLQMVNMLLNILERVLAFSSQEVGAAASHQQSATESGIINQATDNRIKFTESFLDEAERADMRLLYDAMMAYSDDEIFANIAALNDAKEKELKAMGFEIEERAHGTETMAGVKGSKAALRVDDFASIQEGEQRRDFGQIASGMAAIIAAMMNNPVMMDALGQEQIVEWLNRINLMAGLPEDFQMRVTHVQPKGQELQKLIAEIAQKISAAEVQKLAEVLGKEVIKPLQENLGAVAKQTGELGQATQQLGQAAGELGQKTDAIGQATAQLGQQAQSEGEGLVKKFQEIDAINQANAEALQRLESIVKMAMTPAPPLPNPNDPNQLIQPVGV